MSIATNTALEHQAIGHVIRRLRRRYAGRHDDSTIRRTVEQLERQYVTATVHTFVPLLVERDAKRLLDGGRAPELGGAR